MLSEPPGRQSIRAVEEGREGDQYAIKMVDESDSRPEHGASRKYGLLASKAPSEDQADREGVDSGNRETGEVVDTEDMETEKEDQQYVPPSCSQKGGGYPRPEVCAS